MGCGSSFVDFVSKPFESVSKEVSRVADDIGDVATDAYHDVSDWLEDDLEDDIVDYARDIATKFNEHLSKDWDVLFDVIDSVGDLFGFSGITKFGRDVATGLDFIIKEAIHGNWKAIGMIVVTVVLIVVTILSWGSTSGYLAGWLGAMSGLATGAFAVAEIAVVVGYIAFASAMIAMYVYGIYGILLTYATIGESLRNGSLLPLLSAIGEMKEAMNLAFVSSSINNTMGRWMAGGIFYDAPRAGDLLFNPTGSLATTKFLGLQDMNMTLQARYGIYGGDAHGRMVGSMAGDESFSVAKKDMKF